MVKHSYIFITYLPECSAHTPFYSCYFEFKTVTESMLLATRLGPPFLEVMPDYLESDVVLVLMCIL